ncbi:TorF family putative porin [Pseudoroseomonas cervicalis]|uniref:TorF family putative porin n=1 Tax=Teichococcus cervicalis TaxID=204525 RepID=UPI0022F15898|nr:TorF family putative porin [Pseudoroseomonas cervicalis]WBV42100.1 TorF family putative porin [Pseudoroseomonas cervicalis]
MPAATARFPAFSAASLTACLAAALTLPAPAARAFELEAADLTLTATPSLSSDYLFRGLSQTRNRPAAQATLDLQHGSGVYVGGFLSNATFLASPASDTRQELDLMAGYRFRLGGVAFDAGYIAYLYPGQDKAAGGQVSEYQELMLKAAYTIDPLKLTGAFNHAPNFFGRSGQAYALEGLAELSLPAGFTASARLGYQWIERNTVFGTPDYLWYAVGLAREIGAGVTASLSWSGTSIRQRDCAPVADRAPEGQKICDGRLLLTLSRAF